MQSLPTGAEVLITALLPLPRARGCLSTVKGWVLTSSQVVSDPAPQFHLSISFIPFTTPLANTIGQVLWEADSESEISM